jgi:hypothetical protein
VTLHDATFAADQFTFVVSPAWTRDGDDTEVEIRCGGWEIAIPVVGVTAVVVKGADGRTCGFGA